MPYPKFKIERNRLESNLAQKPAKYIRIYAGEEVSEEDFKNIPVKGTGQAYVSDTEELVYETIIKQRDHAIISMLALKKREEHPAETVADVPENPEHVNDEKCESAPVKKTSKKKSSDGNTGTKA